MKTRGYFKFYAEKEEAGHKNRKGRYHKREQYDKQIQESNTTTKVDEVITFLQ